MTLHRLTASQQALVESAINTKTFLRGPAGTGKSSVAVERLSYLLRQGVPGDSILVLTPQRTLQDPYLEIIRSPQTGAGGEVTPATLGGLARRLVDLYWPLAAEQAGFGRPDQTPTFLTLETAQYYMAHIVRPLVEQGYFESVTIDRNRLYSQILDNLNKSAVVGFPHTEIGARLDGAWFGEPERRHIYTNVQDCANRFRQFCLQHNLLDFSLQIEVFTNLLWPQPLVRDYLFNTYRHLLYDNVEEDFPRAHDLLREWLPHFDSALLIQDDGGGYRRFLGADVTTALGLAELCSEQVVFEDSFVMSEGVANLAGALQRALAPAGTGQPIGHPRPAAPGPASEAAERPLEIITARFYPELLEGVAAQIQSLLADGKLAPSEIVVLAPYLSDALRFAITSRLSTHGVPWHTHRPSRSLHDEPAAQALLALAALAHPYWNVRPSKFDVAYALKLAMDMDLVRAQLLAEIVYRPKEFTLSGFDQINPEKQERITFAFGNAYTTLHDWILSYRAAQPLPLDHFLRRLFGEVLSQPGFGLQRDLDAARVAANLIESVRKFRLALEPSIVDRDHANFDFGREYIDMLQDGVIAAQYLESWRAAGGEAVLVAPAYTFLMMNRPVSVQFWLDIGASGWYARLDQPLTHPEVLSREWSDGRAWTFADEEQTNDATLSRLVLGLLHRCRAQVRLGVSDLGEGGFEQRGELLKAFQRVLIEQRG